MFEALELICGCCEVCLSLGSLCERRERSIAAADETAAVTASRHGTRAQREAARGVRLTFTKKRVSEIEFLSGPAAGKRASDLPDMELKRLAISMPHRVARFAIRRYLRHRKRGRFTAPAPVIKR